jgi:hypothetical protein
MSGVSVMPVCVGVLVVPGALPVFMVVVVVPVVVMRVMAVRVVVIVPVTAAIPLLSVDRDAKRRHPQRAERDDLAVDAVAPDVEERERCAQPVNGETIARGIEQSADGHVAADPGPGVEVGDLHRQFGRFPGLPGRPMLASDVPRSQDWRL